MGSSWAEAWGLFFYCEGGRAGTGGQTGGTRRNGRVDGGDAPERGANG